MPIQYAGIREEHVRVRGDAGVFDVSHMGQVETRGPDAQAFLQRMLSNDVRRIPEGGAQYSLLCRDDGGVLDDLFTYRLADCHYVTVTNAANHDKDLGWLAQHAEDFNVDVVDRCDEYAMLAVQGPRARALVQSLSDGALPLRMHCCQRNIAGVPMLVCGTGYTGEDGVELLLCPDDATTVWDALTAAGATPVGLGARDTLRLEGRLSLYGNEIDETTNPLEAGLGWVVKPAKGDFIGRDAIEKVRGAGPARRLIGLEMNDRSVARHGYPVVKDGSATGVVTSGTFGPSVERSIAMAYVASPLAPVGTELGVEIRGQIKPAHVVKTPFHPSKVKKG
jgi:aminomethyltransferase